MKEFKIGGKITLDGGISYRIVDILENDNKEYLICCTIKSPILPIVFEQVKDNGEVFVKEEKNSEILTKLIIKSLKK